MRRVSAFLQRHLPMILAVLVLLAVVVVLWISFAPIAQWSGSAQSFDAVAFLEKYLRAVAIIGGGLLILALIWALIWLPKWQAASVQDVKDRLTIENATRQTLAQIVGGTVLIVGLFFTWSSLEVSREGQVTERFTKAIDQLGTVNDKGEKQLEIRLGGIYALERIARDSKKDHWPIMEVLTAYVRENAPWPPKLPKDAQPSKGDQSPREEPPTTQDQRPPRPATDIQAVLTVLGQRNRTYEKVGQALNLSGTGLRGADLRRAQLQRANLIEAQLQGAILFLAQLQGAYLWEAWLEGANLVGAELQGADLRGAHLQGAILAHAQLKGAINLTVIQLSTVQTLYQADLDPPLLEQIKQQYPQLLEKPPE